MLSSKSTYGLMALIEMGACYGSQAVSIKLISRKLALPESYMENIFVVMKKAGWVKGARGPGGGYKVEPIVYQKNMLEMIRSLEDQFLGQGTYPKEAMTQAAFICIENELETPLKEWVEKCYSQITLKKMIEKRMAMEQKELMYYI